MDVDQDCIRPSELSGVQKLPQWNSRFLLTKGPSGGLRTACQTGHNKDVAAEVLQSQRTPTRGSQLSLGPPVRVPLGSQRKCPKSAARHVAAVECHSCVLSTPGVQELTDRLGRAGLFSAGDTCRTKRQLSHPVRVPVTGPGKGAKGHRHACISPSQSRASPTPVNTFYRRLEQQLQETNGRLECTPTGPSVTPTATILPGPGTSLFASPTSPEDNTRVEDNDSFSFTMRGPPAGYVQSYPRLEVRPLQHADPAGETVAKSQWATRVTDAGDGQLCTPSGPKTATREGLPTPVGSSFPSMGKPKRVARDSRTSTKKELRRLLGDGGHSPLDSEMGSIQLLSPVRLTKKMQITMGEERAVTPVRRSARRTLHLQGTDQVLTSTNFCYTPNPALDTHSPLWNKLGPKSVHEQQVTHK